MNFIDESVVSRIIIMFSNSVLICDTSFMADAWISIE